MKKIHYLLLGFMFVLSPMLTSCSEDDNSSSVPSASSPIEGIWMWSFGSVSYPGYCFHVFNSNGSGYYIELDYKHGYEPGKEEDMDPFRYVYDQEDNTVLILNDEGEWKYVIRKLTSNELIWIDPDKGRVETYMKYNGDLDDIEREFDVKLYLDND